MINHQRPTGLKALSLEIKDNYLLKFGYLNQLFHTYLTLTRLRIFFRKINLIIF